MKTSIIVESVEEHIGFCLAHSNTFRTSLIAKGKLIGTIDLDLNNNIVYNSINAIGMFTKIGFSFLVLVFHRSSLYR